MKPLAAVVDEHARRMPDATAFVTDHTRLTWAGYAEGSERLAARLAAEGLAPGERVAVLLPDGPGVHLAYLAGEKAGCIVVGIGPRAGADEVRHLLRRTGAIALLAPARHRDVDLQALAVELRREGAPLRLHLRVEAELGQGDPLLEGAPAPPADAAARRLGADDVFLLNSTSGTTGLPKCVVHDQARWMHFHHLAVEAGALTGDDVFLSALPTPFGFGLWTAHFTPTLLGAPTVLLPRFSPEALVAALEHHRVSVLAAVSTQFILMLDSLRLAGADLSALRVLFTGGEAVPEGRARLFEERTGARVLQFYGSNETGALSRTTLADPPEIRLRTAGRVIGSMHVRLFDAEGRDVTASGRGQPGCRGPLASRGYWQDEGANRRLHTSDGWMLTGDVATLEDGVLTVIGRTADFIVRGGKNISGPAVEQAVASHHDVSLAAAVAMPDPVFGERVCVYVELHPGARLTLDELRTHLAARGVSREWWPERLIVLDALPRSSGGKVAKGALRADIRRRLAQEDGGPDPSASEPAS